MKICARLVLVNLSYGNVDLSQQIPARRPPAQDRAEELALEVLGFLAGDPGVYFTTPHFRGYAAVLVRLRAPKRVATEFLNRRRASLRLP